jgi:hypothetical protein
MEKPEYGSRELETFVLPYMDRIRVGRMEIGSSKSIFNLRVYEGGERGWIPYFIKTLQEHFDSVFSYSVEKGNPPPETPEEKQGKEELMNHVS